MIYDFFYNKRLSAKLINPRGKHICEVAQGLLVSAFTAVMPKPLVYAWVLRGIVSLSVETHL